MADSLDEKHNESGTNLAATPAAAKAAETAEVHEPTAKKETKAPKSNGSRKGGKKAE